MDLISANIEKLRNFCQFLYKQITEQNTTLRDLTEKVESLDKKVSYLENNVTLAQFKFSTDEINNPVDNLDDNGEELELKLIED